MRNDLRVRWRTTWLLFPLLLASAAAGLAQQRAPVPAVNPASRSQVLALYRHYYLAAAHVEPGWTGNLATGDAGTVREPFLCATLRRINYFRAMCGLRGDVVFDPANNALCQQAALMMAAERSISHHPSIFWKNYTPAAAAAAANSNLCLNWSNNLGPGAVDIYMADEEANNADVGHRRWLLFPETAVMGAGIVPTEGHEHPGTNAIWIKAPATSQASSLTRISNLLPSRLKATTWPPMGYVPAPLVFTRWSFSYAKADFHGATVRVIKNGVPVPVAVERLAYETDADGSGPGVGMNTVVWTLPNNVVRPNVDETYQVQVSNVFIDGLGRSFNYRVVSTDPTAAPTAGKLLLLPSDPAPTTDPGVLSSMAAIAAALRH